MNAESVFVGCNGGVVRAFSSRNGELTWRYEQKTESEAVNQVFETDAGIVTITGDGQCRVFSSRTGDVVWDEILPWKDMSSSQDDDEYPLDQDDEYPPEISKIHHIGAVLVGSKENIWWRTTQFWGRSLITGKEGWSYRLPVQATACYVSPPFLFYVTDEIEEVDIQPRLVILSINEEDSTDPPEEVGQVELPKVSSPEEIIVHQQTLYGFALGDVFSFDMVSSKLNWVKKLAVSRLLQADEDLLYLIDGTKMVALNAENGDVVWTRAGVNDISLCNIQELRTEPSRGEEEEFTIDPLPGIKEEQDGTGEACDRCGKPMVMKIGRFGNFLACTGFPDCRTTKPILNYIGVPCPRPGCNGEIVERRARGGRGPFFGCSTYPHDDFITNLRPIPTPCPRCGGMMVQQTQDVVSCTACPWREEIR